MNGLFNQTYSLRGECVALYQRLSVNVHTIEATNKSRQMLRVKCYQTQSLLHALRQLEEDNIYSDDLSLQQTHFYPLITSQKPFYETRVPGLESRSSLTFLKCESKSIQIFFFFTLQLQGRPQSKRQT